MQLAIMQPYFFPYIGYFQLINTVDKFVIYDNIQFTKKGWINRNRILLNGKDDFITLPLKSDSDYLNVNERYIAASWSTDAKKMLNRINGAYKKAPNYEEAYTIIEKCVLFENMNLFDFIFNSIVNLNAYLEIDTKLIVSSSIAIDHSLRGQDKVISLCKISKADKYINSIGGLKLYSKEVFIDQGIVLNFIQSNQIEYKQFKNQFVPCLSIIDVLMFNSKTVVQEYIKSYNLI